MKTTKRTQTILAAICSTTRQTLAVWQKRPDWPGDAADESTLKTYAAQRLEASKKAQRGENADLKRRKLEKQIALLHEQARRAKTEADKSQFAHELERNQFIEVRAHRIIVEGIVNMTKLYWRWATEAIAGERHDGDLLTRLEDAGRDALNRVRETYVECETPHLPTKEDMNEA